LYIEQQQLLTKIDIYEKENNLKLSAEQKIKICSNVSREFDKTRILDFDEFSELVDHNISLDELSNIDFNDEIVSVTALDEPLEMIDFNVHNSNNEKLFFANDILVHNSAVNNTEDADNSSISDSIGTAMTADFMLFLLQDEEMKAKNEIVCKVTKNRFTGKTDTWMMNIDYEHMKFEEMVLPEDTEALTAKAANAAFASDTSTDNGPIIDDNFGMLTAEKQKRAESFANNEIHEIYADDIEILKNDALTGSTLDDELKDIYKNLGI